MKFGWSDSKRKEWRPSWYGLFLSIVMIAFGVYQLIRQISAGQPTTIAFMLLWTGIAAANTVREIVGLVKLRKPKDNTLDGYRYDPTSGRYHTGTTSRYCPYCGTAAEEEYEYCNHCGKRLP